MLTKVKRIIKKPSQLIRSAGSRNLFNWMPDKLYLKMLYRAETGKTLNLECPESYNEKLQWLKLYDRNPMYSKLVDKYTVRNYVSKKIGDEYLIPLIAVYDSVEEIEWESLPRQFVLKCTHGSGSNIICKDKNELNIKEVKKKLNNWMKKNWYWFGREWVYKNVKPRIICEKYMVDESGTELKDYKFFCFNGQTKLIQVDFGRFTNHKRNLYDTNWHLLDLSIKFPNDLQRDIEAPAKLKEMLSLASKLSSNFPHVRVDFYNVRGRIFFGEITFVHGSGFEKFTPPSYDKILGNWINLPEPYLYTSN